MSRPQTDDPLGGARGCLFGVVGGTLLWSAGGLVVWQLGLVTAVLGAAGAGLVAGLAVAARRRSGRGDTRVR